jgi:hypothetical protein
VVGSDSGGVRSKTAPDRRLLGGMSWQVISALLNSGSGFTTGEILDMISLLNPNSSSGRNLLAIGNRLVSSLTQKASVRLQAALGQGGGPPRERPLPAKEGAAGGLGGAQEGTTGSRQDLVTKAR